MITVRNTLPNVFIGFGASSFEHKYCALMHASRLCTFTSSDLAEYVREFISTMQDYGTEKKIATVKPALISDVLPYFTDPSDKEIHAIASFEQAGIF